MYKLISIINLELIIFVFIFKKFNFFYFLKNFQKNISNKY